MIFFFRPFNARESFFAFALVQERRRKTSGTVISRSICYRERPFPGSRPKSPFSLFFLCGLSRARGWGGGGVLKKVLYGEAPPRGPTPYPFIYHFFKKGTPFVYLLLEKGTPFIYLLKKTVFLFLNAWNELYSD